MRLKFYLIGLGIGIIVTAVVMGIALRGRTREMTDDEIMARARQLGMVEATTLTERDSADNTQGTQLLSSDGQSQTSSELSTQNQSGALIAGDGTSGESIANENAAGSSPDGAPREGDEAGSESGNAGGADSPLVVTGEPDDGEAAEEERSDAQTPQSGAGGNEGSGAGAAPETPSSSQADAADAQDNADGGEDDGGTAVAGADSAGGASQSRSDQPSTGSIVVTIPDGCGSEEICELLQTAGVIDSAAAFNNFLVQSDRDRFIGTGARLIPRGATYEEVGFIISGR